jgi:hypothetical protein
MKRIRLAGVAAALAAVAFASATDAAVVEFALGTVAATSPSGITISPPNTAGKPWVDVKIEDTLVPNQVKVTVSSFLQGQTTLTGLLLNTTAAPGVTAITAADAVGTGGSPFPFAAVNATNATNQQSRFDTTQDMLPTGTTRNLVGFYDLWLRFPNNGSSSFMDSETETFTLTSTGTPLTASSFLLRSSPTAGGLPNPSFYALAVLTNADGSGGTPGSGIGYVAALSPVPEPNAFPLMVFGLVGVGALVLRRRIGA